MASQIPGDFGSAPLPPTIQDPKTAKSKRSFLARTRIQSNVDTIANDLFSTARSLVGTSGQTDTKPPGQRKSAQPSASGKDLPVHIRPGSNTAHSESPSSIRLDIARFKNLSEAQLPSTSTADPRDHQVIFFLEVKKGGVPSLKCARLEVLCNSKTPERKQLFEQFKNQLDESNGNVKPGANFTDAKVELEGGITVYADPAVVHRYLIGVALLNDDEKEAISPYTQTFVEPLAQTRSHQPTISSLSTRSATSSTQVASVPRSSSASSKEDTFTDEQKKISLLLINGQFDPSTIKDKTQETRIRQKIEDASVQNPVPGAYVIKGICAPPVAEIDKAATVLNRDSIDFANVFSSKLADGKIVTIGYAYDGTANARPIGYREGGKASFESVETFIKNELLKLSSDDLTENKINLIFQSAGETMALTNIGGGGVYTLITPEKTYVMLHLDGAIIVTPPKGGAPAIFYDCAGAENASKGGQKIFSIPTSEGTKISLFTDGVCDGCEAWFTRQLLESINPPAEFISASKQNTLNLTEKNEVNRFNPLNQYLLKLAGDLTGLDSESQAEKIDSWTSRFEGLINEFIPQKNIETDVLTKQFVEIAQMVLSDTKIPDTEKQTTLSELLLKHSYGLGIREIPSEQNLSSKIQKAITTDLYTHLFCDEKNYAKSVAVKTLYDEIYKLEKKIEFQNSEKKSFYKTQIIPKSNELKQLELNLEKTSKLKIKTRSKLINYINELRNTIETENENFKNINKSDDLAANKTRLSQMKIEYSRLHHELVTDMKSIIEGKGDRLTLNFGNNERYVTDFIRIESVARRVMHEIGFDGLFRDVDLTPDEIIRRTLPLSDDDMCAATIIVGVQQQQASSSNL